MVRLIILLIIGYFVYQNYWGDESGCDAYASKYSCDYVKEKADYDVYYWRNVGEGNQADEQFIGSVSGLSACQSQAVSYARTIGESWNNRSYVCVLMVDGKAMEKHRL